MCVKVVSREFRPHPSPPTTRHGACMHACLLLYLPAMVKKGGERSRTLV